MVGGRLGGKRLFLHHHPCDWSSRNALFSKASCKLPSFGPCISEADSSTWSVESLKTLGLQIGSWSLWSQSWHYGCHNCRGPICPAPCPGRCAGMWKLKCSVLDAGAKWWLGLEGWGLRGQSSPHCSFPAVMPDGDAGDTGLCETYLKSHDLLPRWVIALRQQMHLFWLPGTQISSCPCRRTRPAAAQHSSCRCVLVRDRGCWCCSDWPPAPFAGDGGRESPRPPDPFRREGRCRWCHAGMGKCTGAILSVNR